MKKTILLITALLLGITAMQAKPVDVAKAQRLGQQFIQNKTMFAKSAVNQCDLAYTFRADNGMATAYVFNFDGGFVVVSADDCYHPILGYSDHGNFDYDNAPDGLLFMLGEVTREIAQCVAENIPMTSDVVCQWKNLEEYGLLNPGKNIALVGPLVQTKWDQGAPYNMYVPNGWPTGCVATAMAQLMKYWEWPIQGTGEHSYQWMGQTLTANFGETTYDWANMVNVYSTGNITPENKEAVAILMSHCGISVDMMYASDGSGAFSPDVPIAINNYFSYSDRATYITKAGYSYDEWIALLKSNLDQHIPLYYSGQGTDGGHAFICHGYDNDGLFYFNWGWGGSSDGWFLIDGDKFEFPNSQGVVYDFIPDYVYNGMPQVVENLAITIDSDVSRIAHLSWTNPTETMQGQELASIDRAIVKRNGVVVQEITEAAPGQAMTCDDEVPFFDQFEYTVLVVAGDNYGRTTTTTAVFGPYCEWTVLMTSSGFQGWDGGGITVQNAAGSYIDFLTTTTSSAQMQRFQMALGNNNLYWTAPNSNISNISFKVKDTQNQIVYQYDGPSSGLEAGLLRTLNNSCGNENTCEAPYNMTATLDPENDVNVILAWESDHDPEFGYCIYRDGLLFNMAHETRYVDEYTNPGGHCYYVTALCTGGETANSNEYCITSGSGCNEPSDFYYEYTSNKKVQLFWSAPENTWPTGYIIYRKTDDMTSYKEIKRTKLTNVKDTSCSPGTAYQYAVVAYYDTIDCTSTYANDLFDPMKYYVRVEWSNVPQNLKAELMDNGETMSASLMWRPAFLATGYTITRNGEEIGEVTEAAFTDENLEAGETYCYTVIAHGEDFEESSNEACVTVPEAPEPPVLPCNAPTNLRREAPMNMAHIAWNVPDEREPDSYTVIIVNNLTNETIEVTGISDLFYEDEITVEEMDKSYKVKAVYEECESEFALTVGGDDFVNINNLSVTENGMNVTLYPNPTTGQLTIEMEGMALVEVYNLVGQCLLRQTVSEGTAIIDMSGLQEGVYMVKVSTQSGSVMQKVVKM